MYGTVALCRVPANHLDELRALAAAEDELGIDGYLGTDILLVDNHPDTLIMAVRFRDRDSYVANADSPAQHQRYLQFRALMDEDPVWYDGTWVSPA